MPEVLSLEYVLDWFKGDFVGVSDLVQQFLCFLNVIIYPVTRRLFYEQQWNYVNCAAGKDYDDCPLFLVQIAFEQPERYQFTEGEGSHGDCPDDGIFFEGKMFEDDHKDVDG